MGNCCCHEVTEICPGLLISGYRDVARMVQMGADVLVPLDSLSGGIWDTGFRGEILYCPITDYGVLPDDALERLVEDIIRGHYQTAGRWKAAWYVLYRRSWKDRLRRGLRVKAERRKKSYRLSAYALLSERRGIG